MGDPKAFETLTSDENVSLPTQPQKNLTTPELILGLSLELDSFFMESRLKINFSLK